MSEAEAYLYATSVTTMMRERILREFDITDRHKAEIRNIFDSMTDDFQAKRQAALMSEKVQKWVDKDNEKRGRRL